MHQRYTEEFKRSVIAKIMSRGNRSIEDVCRQEGVLAQTAGNWLKVRGTMPGMKKPRETQKWSAEEKLKALSESSSMSEAELGVYLRKVGLHGPRLTEWRAEALKSLAGPSQGRGRDERDEKIRELEREILRKDKALAEASALLILQKKVHLIWARSDEERK